MSPVRQSGKGIKIFYDPRMGANLPRVALAPRIPAIQNSPRGIGVYASYETVSIRGITVLVPGLVELYIYMKDL